MPVNIAAKIRHALKDIKDPKIVVLGLTYKPDTYDTRNSPAQKIIEILKADGYRVNAYDPKVEGCQYSSIAKIAKGADALVVLVEHKVIRDELAKKETEIKKAMRRPLIIRFYYEATENG